ncbi:MAG: phytoene desaturase family protein [Blastochloris sp.]|nr:phytoene desaturase family protein [Blastochloris sp.]
MKLKESTRVLVIGAGLAGLATALRLQQAGAQVTILEKNKHPGGKLQEHKAAGYRWDMGPSLLTMPFVLEDLFKDLGLTLENYLTLKEVNPICRYFWDDGQIINEDAAFFRRPDVSSFLKYCAGIYDLSAEAFLMHPPEDFWKAFQPRHWRKLKHLPKVATFKTLAEKVNAHFSDPKLRQLFQRFATYNGSNPAQTPATFNVIPYVEAHYGGWYADGGMARIPEVLTKIALERGVTIRYDSEVIRCDGRSVLTKDEKTYQADLFVVNGDAIRAYRDWLRVPGHRKQSKKMSGKELSLSGFVMLLGVARRYPQLAHHNIFFSRDYDREFQQLFKEKCFPCDPTIYVSITARTNPDHAPAGEDNYFVLVNAPSNTHTIDWVKQSPSFAEAIIRRLDEHGLNDLSNHITYQHLFTPADFASRDVSTEGALYGWASHSPLTALRRPPLQSPDHDSLYFVGGTTHPGGGIPLVLLSARMVVDKILKSHGSSS